MNQVFAVRRWVLVVVFILGAMVGMTVAGYVLYAWLPPTLILRDAPPSYLKFDPQGLNAHYRDVYVVSVARRFVEIGGDDLALQEALSLLGVSTGDVTFDEALAMVRGAALVVGREAEDRRRFALSDSTSLQTLLSALERASPPAVTPAHPRRGIQGIGAVLTLLVVAAAGVALWFFQRNAAPFPASAAGTSANVAVGRAAPSPPGPTAPTSAEPTVTIPVQERPPTPQSASTKYELHCFTCTYVHGDENFDEAFDVTAENGELLGECFVSIGDRFGLAQPPQVTALSVGLFEKNTMQTVSGVLLTPFAFQNEVIYGRMSGKGERVMAVPGGVLTLHNNHLEAEVKVEEVRFGSLEKEVRFGPLKENAKEGYFEHVTLAIRIFRRA